MKRKKISHPSGDAAWLLTYADMITLLMALFLLLFSMSDINPAKFEAIQAQVSKEMTGTQPLMPIHEIIKKIQAAIKKNNLESSIKVSTDGAGIVIEFQSKILFNIGEDMVVEGAKPILAILIKIMAAPEYLRYGIELEGHTDDIPIKSERFPSNWELSAARATSITKLFVEEGFNIKRLRAIGYADSQPISANRDKNGVAIPENQAKNRRAVIRLYPQVLKPQPVSTKE